MPESPTTLDSLEVGAKNVDRLVDAQVAHCIEVSADPVALRNALGGFSTLRSQRAEFASCLFSLDLARMGEPEARRSFAAHAGILLEAHRDPALTHYLLGNNPELTERWERFVPLLLEFDRQRNAPSTTEPALAPLEETAAALDLAPSADEVFAAGDGAPFSRQVTRPAFADARANREVTDDPVTAEVAADGALDAVVARCFASRGDLSALCAGVDALAAFPESDRRELALCVFNLARARLGDDGGKLEFARRTQLLLGAYREPELAAALIGESEGLRILWSDLRPYLEEFFEGSDDDELEVIEELATPQLEALPPAAHGAVDRGPPPPPPSATPAPGTLSARPGPPPPRISSTSHRRLSLPPAPAPAVLPSPETLAFWTHAEKMLDLLPDESGMLSGNQAFALGSKEQRTGLKKLARDAVAQFSGSPEARAMACLLELYLAAEQREKTLFGKPNEKRQIAIQEALSLLAADPVAVGHVAVLFESDGPDTLEGFGRAIELVHRYLGFCLRRSLDPLSAEAVSQFRG